MGSHRRAYRKAESPEITPRLKLVHDTSMLVDQLALYLTDLPSSCTAGKYRNTWGSYLAATTNLPHTHELVCLGA